MYLISLSRSSRIIEEVGTGKLSEPEAMNDSWKHRLLDTEGNLTHSGCNSMHKSCESQSQTKTQPGEGSRANNPTPSCSAIDNS